MLGIAAGEVVAYSNCRSKCVIFDPHYKNDTYRVLNGNVLNLQGDGF
ncbi:hypothetical protein QUF82_13920 [Thiotrichales bacterium HSG14]|nr:hypothetical protein [Thiotrichales bacterium HSG14]